MKKFVDLLLAEYISDPDRKYDTEKLIAKYSDIEIEKNENVGVQEIFFIEEIFKNQSKKDLYKNKIYEEIESPLLLVLKEMEEIGIKIDRKKLFSMKEKLEKENEILEKEIYFLAGEDFNISSPKQVGNILFEKMGIPPFKKTKTGFSVDSEVLEFLSKDYEIAHKIVLFRKNAKILSTYIEAFLKLTEKKETIHTTYSQTVAATGRLSSINPNLQNIPAGEDFAGEIREAFIPQKENNFIMACDYSQIELRILAYLSKDKNLLKSFGDGQDIHTNTAKSIFGKENISKDERKIAKVINFSVIYGVSAFGLSKTLGLSVKDCKNYIDKFYENYPGVREFFDKTVKFCEENGYVETIFGRKRFISGINDRNNNIKQAAIREACNMPIQGSNADIVKIAMINIYKFLKEKNLKSKMLLQVHDELVFEVEAEELEIMKREIKSLMENVVNFSEIKFVAEVGVGKNWKEAK